VKDLDPVLPEPKLNYTPTVCVFGRLRDVSELELEVVPVGLSRSPRKPLRDGSLVVATVQVGKWDGGSDNVTEFVAASPSIESNVCSPKFERPLLGDGKDRSGSVQRHAVCGTLSL
jgi:hypothetical protein